MRSKLVAGNWKMHGGLAANAALLSALLTEIDTLPCEVVVCPPKNVYRYALRPNSAAERIAHAIERATGGAA